MAAARKWFGTQAVRKDLSPNTDEKLPFIVTRLVQAEPFDGQNRSFVFRQHSVPHSTPRQDYPGETLKQFTPALNFAAMSCS